jgi:hypothetical protein
MTKTVNLFIVGYDTGDNPVVRELTVSRYSNRNDGWIAEGEQGPYYHGYFFDDEELFKTPKLAIRDFAIKTRQRINRYLDDLQDLEGHMRNIDKIKVIRREHNAKSN